MVSFFYAISNDKEEVVCQESADSVKAQPSGVPLNKNQSALLCEQCFHQ